MEGRISEHFYSIQNYYLSMSTSYLNGGDWMRKFITKLLHITHSQWIYRNFRLHDQKQGYLRLKDRISVLVEIETLADTAPEEVPPESKFLLEFDLDRLCDAPLENQQYWVHAMKAARCAGQRINKMGARARRIQAKILKRRNLRSRLGVDDIERQIRQERHHILAPDWREAPLQQHSPFRRRKFAGLAAPLRPKKKLIRPG